jgi:twitching motility protein PilT
MVRVEAFWVLSAELMKEIASYILPADRRGAWPTEKELDASFTHNGARFRVNAYYETRGASFAIRRIAEQIPTPEILWLPKAFMELANRTQGLILVTGSTGSGKSTTLAALIEHINQTRAAHIITIEDPIEYVFESKKSLIHQREIATHTQSFPRAIKSALREDPDVVVIGEMRDPETMAAAITLAETGHLVISTLHTNDTVQAIDRIVDSFPIGAQAQIRVQLALSLAGILSQSLLLKLKGNGRVAARELLISNDAVRSLIIRGLTHQIYSMIELGATDGMVLMDRALESLYLSRQISYESFASRVRDRDILAIHAKTPWA